MLAWEPKVQETFALFRRDTAGENSELEVTKRRAANLEEELGVLGQLTAKLIKMIAAVKECNATMHERYFLFV